MDPGGTLVEPYLKPPQWNPGGTFVKPYYLKPPQNTPPLQNLVEPLVEPWWNLGSGSPRTTPEPICAETPKLSAVGENGKIKNTLQDQPYSCWHFPALGQNHSPFTFLLLSHLPDARGGPERSGEDRATALTGVVQICLPCRPISELELSKRPSCIRCLRKVDTLKLVLIKVYFVLHTCLRTCDC